VPSNRTARPAARADRVVVVGAGLGGLSAALHLAGAGRQVRILEAGSAPGGLMGRWTSAGYSFDTGPTVLTMPSLIDEALAAVGESRSDWLDLVPVEPSYRGVFADGSVLRSFADSQRMADEVAAVCGSSEARGYLRLVAYLTRLFQAEYEAFMRRDLDTAADLARPEALTLLRLGGLGRLDRVVGRHVRDERLRRLFTFQAMYAGLAPDRARAIYGVIAYLDSIGGAWFPRGGMHTVATALAGAAAKHGVEISYSTRAVRVEFAGGRAGAVLTSDGERIGADAVVLNCDVETAYRRLLPAGLRPRRLARPRYSPSAFVWHVGSSRPLPAPAHHTISFGAGWTRTFREVIDRGQLMSDPSLLITAATVTDPDLAPAGRHTYYVLAPCPNTDRGRIDWARVGPAYEAEIRQVLARRGLDSEGAFSTGVEVSRTVTPAEWSARGLAAGSPFSLAHTVRQTGPLRHPTQHPAVPNLLFCGAGCQPGVGVPPVLISGRLAADRLTSR